MFYPTHRTTEGGTMKGLASVLGVILLSGCAALAGPLEISIGGGVSAVSLDAFNGILESWNALIEHLNETFLIHPDVSGTVRTLDLLSSGMGFQVGEWYQPLGWLALGARFEYEQSETGTRGTYVGAETSTIDIALEWQTIGVLAGARFLLLDAGVRLSGDLALGYFHGALAHSVTFEVPSEYPDALAGLPPKGDGRHTGSTIGLAAQISVDVPIVAGLSLGATLGYRSAVIGALADASGTALDLDGDETSEEANLSGIGVRLTLSFDIDLSLDGEGEKE
jgi:hypothetical protein